MDTRADNTLKKRLPRLRRGPRRGARAAPPTVSRTALGHAFRPLSDQAERDAAGGRGTQAAVGSSQSDSPPPRGAQLEWAARVTSAPSVKLLWLTQ